MSFGNTIARAWEQNILLSALFELTYTCNLDCFFCYNDRDLAGKPLSFDQYLELMRGLRALGTMNLVLSGGEPLAHKDFFRIGRAARELGFVVRIKSNGHGLGQAVAQRIKDDIDPFVIEISLHGACAATHDRQTRQPGSFERLMGNIAILQSLNIRIKLNSALTAWNEHEIETMYALTDRLGIPLQFDPEITARDNGDQVPLDISPSREGIQTLYQIQLRRSQIQAALNSGAIEAASATASASAAPRRAPKKHCGAGSATLAVDPYGNVYPCVQWRRSIGNLHTETVQEIWQQSPALSEIRTQTQEAATMMAQQGPDARGAAFCPGTASQQTGNPVKIYPAAQLRLALRRSVRQAATEGSA